MAHNSDYTHIWAESSDGVNDWEVARALGRSSHDWGQLCGDKRWDDTLQQWVRVNAINKWARFKPICYNQHNELTDAQFKGKLSDNTDNIFFGLKIASNRTLSTDIGTWVNLHDATYTYIPPDGTANAPFRITDFTSIETPQTGYDSLAVPNPSGQFTTQQGYYTKSLDGIQAQYDPSNIRGVDLARILVPTQGSLTDVMSRTFPCILVSSPEDDEHYFTALDYDSGANPVPKPMYDTTTGSYRIGSWLANFDKPVYNSSLNPFRANTSGLKMTLFFIALPSNLYIDLDGHPCLDSGKQYDLYDNWFDIADMDGFIGPSIPVPFPNAIYQNLTLIDYYAGVKVKAVDMLTIKSGSTITGIGLTLAQEQMDSRTLNWSAVVSSEYTAPGSSPTPAQSRTITGQTGGIIQSMTFDAEQDYGVLGGLQPGGRISGSIITTVNDSGTTIQQITNYSFII